MVAAEAEGSDDGCKNRRGVDVPERMRGTVESGCAAGAIIDTCRADRALVGLPSGAAWVDAPRALDSGEVIIIACGLVLRLLAALLTALLMRLGARLLPPLCTPGEGASCHVTWPPPCECGRECGGLARGAIVPRPFDEANS